ncbi:MAG: hypothetical protein J0I33_00975 [Microbacterium ginsengisoli]|jgi:hypothetical protein|uniref:hypothetical protein n=1 Tax=Microbacterium TaxID=33882 RepID=UPI0006F5107D|nr:MULTISPECIES: hypothetical protein [Microbacterium]MBN9197204.1 hypothetical protein [Microbacterium ginsengisoli]KQR91137.1 hypothetical protein ASF93_07200 [Microbacterium sp. Leaf347]KQS01149.1 hypothetical protein ASG00_10030 [Microbacterium sp. Leaf351]KXC07206.1 hypothetical protein MhomT_01275 [Microbacterium hominis]MBN9208654.1 hypothetical protein [Microbacterium ginsengisoli]
MTNVSLGSALPPGFERFFAVDGVDDAPALIGIRSVRSGHLVDAYPAGTHDLELATHGLVSAADVQRVTHEVLKASPRSRRVILAVPEQDLTAIAWAEDAGYRFVVDVETLSGSFSLLVTEPDWVLAQPHILEDIPLKE